MLWYKGWLETRYRLLFMFGFTVVIFTLFHSAVASKPAALRAGITSFTSFTIPIAIMMICAFLAGAGIVTQPSLQASKDLHGSTLLTLSMPVSRLRLLAVRAAVGWLEVAGLVAFLCCEIWFGIPELRSLDSPQEILEQATTLIACSSTLYFLSVLLATVLDDQWRQWTTLLAGVGIGWLCVHLSVPPFADLFHAMSRDSPILAHSVPWHTMAFSLGLGALLFLAALKVAQTREY